MTALHSDRAEPTPVRPPAPTAGWHNFQDLAAYAVGTQPDWQIWIDPLARLLEAISRGIGALPRAALMPAGQHGDPPPHLIESMDGLWLLPRQAAAWRLVRSWFEHRCPSDLGPFADQAVREALDEILPAATQPIDNALQRQAAAALCDAATGVLTGGPGTGKTASIATLLALCIRLDPSLDSKDICLCAPTGKAANRLRESLGTSMVFLNLNEREIQVLQGIDTITLHRCLGWSPVPPERGGPWRHGPERPLPYRLVVVDEVSMVDVELMAALCAAIGPDTRLLLAGDRDQLEAVEAGGVLAELVRRGCVGPLPATLSQRLHRRCAHGAETWRSGLPAQQDPHPLAGIAYGLTASWRARSAPQVLELAALVKPGARARALDVEQCCHAHPDTLWLGSSHQTLEQRCRGAWRRLLARCADWQADALPSTQALNEALGAFQLLVGTNTQVERANQSGQAIARAGSGGDGLFHGTPVIIEANRPDLQLANGDLGLALGNGPGSPATCLIVPGRAQAIPLVVLPQHRPAFAMTIHKSQGSEWADVAIDIPARAEELLTRNLLYTAVTRSSGRIMLRSSMTDLDHCLMATSTEGRPA